MLKYRPLLLCGILSLAALVLCVYLHNPIAWILTAAGIVLAAVFLFLYRREDRGKIILSAAAVLLCIASFSYSYLNEYRYALEYAGKTSEVVAYVVGHLPADDGEKRVRMRLLSVNRESVERPVDLAVVLSKEQEDLSIGDTVRFYAEVVRYYEYTAGNTVTSDLANRIYLKAELTKDSKPMLLADTPSDFGMKLERQREKLLSLCDLYLSPQTSQIVKGMLYADRNGMEEMLSLEFSYSGFAHLLAVSGLHVQIIASIISGLTAILLWFFKHRKPTAKVLTLLLIWGYILLIGCPISAVRSGIMVTVSGLGYLMRRRSDSLNSLGFAVVVILIADPFAICSLGFWMSVMATFGVTALHPTFVKPLSMLQERISERVCDKKKRRRLNGVLLWVRNLLDGCVVGSCAQIGLLPVYLFVFSYLPLGALLIGGLLGYLFSAILFVGVLFTVCGLAGFTSGAAAAAAILEPLVTLLQRIVGWTARQSWLCFSLRQEFAVVFLIFLVLCLVLMNRNICKRLFHTERRTGIGIFLATFFCLGLLFTQYYQYNIIEIAAVGSYDNKDVAVITENKATVFLCYGSEANAKEMLQHLKVSGVSRIERLILLMPYNGTPDGVEYLERFYKIDEMCYNAYGLPGGKLMQPVETGDLPLSGGMIASFVYSEQGLNVSLEYGERQFDLIQDLSLLGRNEVFDHDVDVLMVYDPMQSESVIELETDFVVLLEDCYLPEQIKSGQKVVFSMNPTVIRVDNYGSMEEP